MNQRNSDNTAAASIWEPLVRQRRFIIVFVLSAVVTALALTYVYSEKYESYTTISYRVQEVTRFKSQQNEAMGSPAPQAPFKVIGQTLQEMLEGDAILGEVVSALHLDVKPPPRGGPWYRVAYETVRDTAREYGGYAMMLLKYGRLIDENPTASAINELRSNIKITNRDSYLFRLQVRDKDPERAARIVDHMAQVLASTLLESDRQPGRSRTEQFRSLLDAKSAAIRQQRDEIEALLNKNHVASVPLETKQLAENLATLQLEESRVASEVAAVQTRRASVQSKLQSRQLGLDAPRLPSGSSQYIAPDDFRKLSSQALFDDVELKSLIGKQNSLRTAIDSISARLRKLPEIQNRLDTLSMALTSSEHEFALLNEGYQEAAVRATSSVSEVRVLHPAVIPSGPVTPIKIYHVLLAGVLGALFAVGLVYLLAYLNIRILFESRGPAWRAPLGTAPESPSPESPPSATDKESARNG
ncbi:hypothetical protein BH11PSE9_BH11PSE9_20500 [soil metagenome]